jgi:hypothetical protein
MLGLPLRDTPHLCLGTVNPFSQLLIFNLNPTILLPPKWTTHPEFPLKMIEPRIQSICSQCPIVLPGCFRDTMGEIFIFGLYLIIYIVRKISIMSGKVKSLMKMFGQLSLYFGSSCLDIIVVLCFVLKIEIVLWSLDWHCYIYSTKYEYATETLFYCLLI